MTNYHTHTYYCDGSSRPAEYAREAVAAGFTELGFSGHAPVPFSNGFAIPKEKLSAYCEEVLEVRRSFGQSLKIWLGLEVDYIPGITSSFDSFRQQGCLDYLIGSVHLVKPAHDDRLWFIDGPEKQTYDDGLAQLFDGDIRKAVTAYYQQLGEMVTTQRPDIVGHADKVKMHNAGRYFREDEAWYVALTQQMLEQVKAAGSILEVNSRGLYKGRSNDFFPGMTLLRKAREMDIAITLSSDAHRPEELTLGLSQARQLIESLGFREKTVHPFIKGYR